MLNTQVHVCIVSAQAAPNLLPALDPALRPREVVLLVSAKMTRHADALEAVLREAGLATTRIGIADEHDYRKLESALMDLAAARDGEFLALNLTGGTKLMALAAYSIAQAAGWPAFYVDLDTDEVIEVGGEHRRKTLASPLRLSHYFRAHGYQREATPPRTASGPGLLGLQQTLVTQIAHLESGIGELNGLATKAEGDKILRARMNEAPSRALATLLRHFEEAGVLTVQGRELAFADPLGRSFAAGGWLEDHVYRTVIDISPGLIRDKDTSVQVVDDRGFRHELDVAFMARNRLFVIECKTAKMSNATTALFKLAEICRLVGGLRTQGMLVSYRPVSDHAQDLARALNIQVVQGPELARLKDRLTRWVGA